jgi:hypothetical protein
MTKRVITAEIQDCDTDIMLITFSNGDQDTLLLFYPENDIVQIDDGEPLIQYFNAQDSLIVDEERYRFSKLELGIERPQENIITVSLDHILFFDNEPDVIQEQQNALNEITQKLTPDQQQQLESLFSFVVNRTEAHYAK